MKILFVVDYYQPQLGYSEYFIPRELKRKGHKVKILTSNYYFPFPNYDETAGKILGPRKQEPGVFMIDGIEVTKEPLKHELFTRAIFDNHEQHIAKFKPDLVIVDKSAGYNLIRMAQLKKKYQYKLISYDAHLPSGFMAVGNIYVKEVAYWLFRVFFSRLLNSQTDKFIAVQEDTRIIMERYYGQKDIVHIPLGTDTDRFRFDKVAGQKIRKQLDIKPKDFVVIYTGKIIKTKGVVILFRALSRLWKKHGNIHLILVGNGNEEYVQLCYKQITMDERAFVHVVGFKDNKELYKYYSAANVGVWPLEESTAMNDAAACSVAFIANDQIGARIRLSNHNALLYKQGNDADLAKKIQYLYDRPALTRQMGKNGKALIDTKLSWNKVTDQYLKYAE